MRLKFKRKAKSTPSSGGWENCVEKAGNSRMGTTPAPRAEMDCGKGAKTMGSGDVCACLRVAFLVK